MSKIYTFFLLVCLILAPPSQAQTPANPLSPAELKEKAAEEEMQRQELVNLQGETVRAIQMNNTAFFRRVYSDDFVGILPAGVMVDKAGLLSALQSSSSSVKYSTFVATDIRVRIYETTAVVTCLWSARGISEGRNFAKQFRVITVYVDSPRGWQAVGRQETQLPG
jgi:Domain of unknown function (DUF4440)